LKDFVVLIIEVSSPFSRDLGENFVELGVE